MKEVNLGETGDHLLFGINYFEQAGYSCEILPTWTQKTLPIKYKLMQKLFFYKNFGDLGQQLDALDHLNDIDLIYAPCGTQTQYLQYLRASKRLDTPIVALQHHPEAKGRLDLLRANFRAQVWSGLDSIPCLNQYTAKQIAKQYGAYRSFTVPWGADLSFYEYSEKQEVGEGLIVAGRTGRDFKTVIQGLNNTNLDANLVYIKGDLGYSGRISSNINLTENVNGQPVPGEKKGWMKQRELNSLYKRSRVIGIPLHQQNSLAGITSLMDCLGNGKPVIMTKNPYIDLDIEAEGIGHWVDSGDSKHWRELVQWYDQHPKEARQMGKRAREIADSTYNSFNFAKSLMLVFDQIMSDI